MIFKDNKVYDNLKFLALIVLPMGTFISTFMNIWGISYAEQVQATFVALDVLIGAIVTVSGNAYKKSLEEKSE